MIIQTDIVIVGAGIVGLTCALALAPSGLNVTVVDAGSDNDFPTGVAQHRVSAISKASQRIFENLQVWQELSTQRITPYRAMSVWEQDSFAKIEFDARKVYSEDLGHIIENQNLVAALTKKTKQIPNLQVLFESKIKSINLSEDTQVLQIENASQNDVVLTAKFVVGADGGNSMVCKAANFPQTWWDYDQLAIVATISTENSHAFTARQVFTPTGPLALLPLWQENRCSIVWSQDIEKAETLLSMDEKQFCQNLSTTFDMRAGPVSLVSERKSFPLRMQYARQWLDDGVMIIGDAAHTIHPLAGQGANLGILDAVSLAERINELVKSGADYTRARHLRVTERWRKAEAVKMTATMEAFKRLFAESHPLKKLFRGAGMSLVNEIMPVKSEIIRQAMGTSGELPKLAAE